MNIALLGTIACLIAWIVLAFVVALPNGWVHLPLAIGTALLTVGIVRAGRSPAEQKPPKD